MALPVTFLAVGSRGDVEPLAVLAGALTAAGRAATVIAIDDYADLVAGYGARFRGLGPGLAEVLRLGHGPLGRLAFRTPLAQPVLLRRWLGGLAEPLAAALAEVPAGSAVVTGLASRDAALALVEQRGCRMATVLHTAVLPTRLPESHLEGRRFAALGPAVPALTRWYWHTTSGVSRATSAVFRRRFGLARRSDAGAAHAADRHAIWLAADPVLVPPASDWPDGVRQTGAVRPPPAEAWRPPDELAAFLAAGPPPVLVGLGSFNDAGGDRWLTMIRTAARTSGRRVLTPAVPGTRPGRLDEWVCSVGALPHDRVLPLLAGVLHHGGAGTTAAGLRAGVPSMAVPAMFDQAYHAHRLHTLGVGPPPVPLRRLDAATLAVLLQRLPDAAHRERAAVVAGAVSEVDGTAATLAALTAFAESG